MCSSSPKIPNSTLTQDGGLAPAAQAYEDQKGSASSSAPEYRGYTPVPTGTTPEQLGLPQKTVQAKAAVQAKAKAQTVAQPRNKNKPVRGGAGSASSALSSRIQTAAGNRLLSGTS